MITLCRLCAKDKHEEEIKTTLTDPTLNILQKLIDCCRWNSFDDDEKLPESVCFLCYDKLHQSWLFANKVDQAQKELRASIPQREVPSVTANEWCSQNVIYSDDDFGADPLSDLRTDSSDVEEKRTATKDINLKECVIRLARIDEFEGRTNVDVNEMKIDDVHINHEKLDHSTSESDAETEPVTFGKSNTEEDVEFQKNFSKEDCNPDGTVKESAVLRLKLKSWNQMEFKCLDCDVVCVGLESIQSHYSDVHPDEKIKYSCFDCPKHFLDCKHLMKHCQKYHKLHRSVLRHCCRICSKFFWSLRRKTNHQNKHSEFECDECGKIFYRKNSLTKHKRTHRPFEERKMFVCDICQKQFASKDGVRAHLKNHCDSTRHKSTCEVCGKHLMKYNIAFHLKSVHSTTRSFVCDLCGKAFTTDVHLRSHKRSHQTFRPHKCETCSKEFRTNKDLVYHTRIHTGEKPYPCEYCEKRYRTSSDLKDHIRTHTGEKPYSCKFCPLKFSHLNSANRHMKRIHKSGVKEDAETMKQQEENNYYIPISTN